MARALSGASKSDLLGSLDKTALRELIEWYRQMGRKIEGPGSTAHAALVDYLSAKLSLPQVEQLVEACGRSYPYFTVQDCCRVIGIPTREQMLKLAFESRSDVLEFVQERLGASGLSGRTRGELEAIILRRLSANELARAIGYIDDDLVGGRDSPSPKDPELQAEVRPEAEAWSSSSYQGRPEHQSIQRALEDLGRIRRMHVVTNRSIGGGFRPDVMWYTLEPGKHESAAPKFVFEIEFGGAAAIAKSLASLKHAWDLWNSELFLIVPAVSRDAAARRIGPGVVEGAFHEIQDSLRIRIVEDLATDDLAAIARALGLI